MGQLEALETVASLGLLPDDVQHAVHELGALGVVPLGPVVAGVALLEQKCYPNGRSRRKLLT